MNKFDASCNDLRKFFKKNGTPNPYSMVRNTLKALNEALKLVPELTTGNATIILRPTDALGVQQFVTQFGCHLEYHHQVDNIYNDYNIVPNWK